MARKTAMTEEERRRRHAELAKLPDLPERIAEAKAEYERRKANGGLRRVATAKGNRKAR